MRVLKAIKRGRVCRSGLQEGIGQIQHMDTVILQGFIERLIAVAVMGVQRGGDATGSIQFVGIDERLRGDRDDKQFYASRVKLLLEIKDRRKGIPGKTLIRGSLSPVMRTNQMLKFLGEEKPPVHPGYCHRVAG
jgi:hypothetical protein